MFIKEMDATSLDIQNKNDYTAFLHVVLKNYGEFELIDWCYFINAVQLNQEFILVYFPFFKSMENTLINFFKTTPIMSYDFQSYIRFSILIDLLRHNLR